jgi:hypothetical protein
MTVPSAPQASIIANTLVTRAAMGRPSTLRAKIPLPSWATQGILIADKIRTIRQGVADLFKQILAPT